MKECIIDGETWTAQEIIALLRGDAQQMASNRQREEYWNERDTPLPDEQIERIGHDLITAILAEPPHEDAFWYDVGDADETRRLFIEAFCPLFHEREYERIALRKAHQRYRSG